MKQTTLLAGLRFMGTKSFSMSYAKSLNYSRSYAGFFHWSGASTRDYFKDGFEYLKRHNWSQTNGRVISHFKPFGSFSNGSFG